MLYSYNGSEKCETIKICKPVIWPKNVFELSEICLKSIMLT